MSIEFRKLALWALSAWCGAVGCVAETYLADGYSIKVWRSEDGLPQNTVTAAVQTRDGYLWFGTLSGLARFDGERFLTFDSITTPELRDRRISYLFEDSEATLWVGQETGSLMKYRDHHFEEVRLGPAGTGRKIHGIGTDENRRLWVLRQTGEMEALDGTVVAPFVTTEHAGILEWTRNDRGNIWVFENGQGAEFDGKAWHALTLDVAKHYAHVGGLAASSDDSVWVMRDNRIRRWKDGVCVEDRGEFPWPWGMLSMCVELRDGTLAVGTINSGLYLVYKDGRPAVNLNQSKGLPQNWVRFLYEDREQTLWVGAGSSGLAAVHATAFSNVVAPDNFQGASVLAVAPGSDGSLWIGTEGAGLYRAWSDTWKHFQYSEGLNNPYIWAVTETPDGVVWAGNYWWGGPYHLQDGMFMRNEAVPSRASEVLALLPDVKGNGLLVGRRDGLYRLKAAESTLLLSAHERGAADVAAIAQDSAGDIWCGFSKGGIAHLVDGRVETYGRNEGLGSDAVQCLLADAEGSLWIGTADKGLVRRKDGRFVNVGKAQGLLDSAVCKVLDDGLGYFWVSTRHGLQRIEKKELTRCADGEIPSFSSQKYDQNDGLPIVEFAGDREAAGCRTPDGRLWFATSKGVLSIDPKRIQINRTPPPVVLESLVIDGDYHALQPGGALEPLRPDHQRLEFRFGGLSFVAPNKVSFKYRLDGIDRNWVDSGAKRTAFYSQLPAGTYRFRVIASNNDGIWNDQEASVEFSVSPFFWRTWWFVLLSLVAGISGVAVLARHVTRRRMQKRFEQLERQRELERERTRIAQDIHDDIGTSLIRIAMFSQPERVELDQPQKTAAMLSRIYSTAREMTKALDEIVWAIDPRHDTLDSLVGYMGMFAQEMLSAASIRCRLDVPVEVPSWPLTAEIRHNLFLAFKETLNNVIRHAGASEVCISIAVQAGQVALMVEDNGKGLSSAPSAGGRIGNGLRNIEQRINRIKGRSEITSVPGAGTQVRFLVPVDHRP